MQQSNNMLKPVIKWAGGKGQILHEIRKRYPLGLGTTITKYAEPFVGGGAVLLDILGTYRLKEVFISDTNAELINLYRVIQNNVQDLIRALHQYKDEFLALGLPGQKEYFAGKRERFNELKNDAIHGTELAALFVFLNKTCFNGLYRVNRKGGFNVPMGAYKEPPICDEDNLLQVSRALSNVRISHGDYRESQTFIDEKTFVYFDPPYRPLNATSSFTSYTENCFNDDDQRDLARYILALADGGVHVLVSNSDPHNTDPDDNFFDELYAPLTIERIQAYRMINSKAEKRGPVNELLIHN